MNKETMTAKLLNLVEGWETPESWRGWWDEHESELETLLSRGEFLKLKPCKHDFKWVPILRSQKVALAILNNYGVEYQISNMYHEQYIKELDDFCNEQKKYKKRKQKEFEEKHNDLFVHYTRFSKALAKVLLPTDIIDFPATESQIYECEQRLGFILPTKVKEFFLLTKQINISIGVKIELLSMFTLSVNEQKYCVLGEFWKEADGDQLLIQSDNETIYYYAHEKNEVKKLCDDINELLERKISGYINNN